MPEVSQLDTVCEAADFAPYPLKNHPPPGQLCGERIATTGADTAKESPSQAEYPGLTPKRPGDLAQAKLRAKVFKGTTPAR